jgi:hypothetical protein
MPGNHMMPQSITQRFEAAATVVNPVTSRLLECVGRLLNTHRS